MQKKLMKEATEVDKIIGPRIYDTQNRMQDEIYAKISQSYPNYFSSMIWNTDHAIMVITSNNGF